MTPADIDVIVASTTDPAAATLARALREAWAERDALRQERDEARAERRAARLDRDAAEEKLAALRGGR